MPESSDYFKECAFCGDEREMAKLKTPGFDSYVLLETGNFAPRQNHMIVMVWFCPTCGHIDLQAQLPYSSDQHR